MVEYDDIDDVTTPYNGNGGIPLDKEFGDIAGGVATLVEDDMMDIDDVPVTQEDAWAVIRYEGIALC